MSKIVVLILLLLLIIIDGQAILMDKDGNPLKKVEYSGDHDNEDEVAPVDNDMTRSMASERVGFGTQSQDLPEELQTICDNLDIRVRGLRDDNVVPTCEDNVVPKMPQLLRVVVAVFSVQKGLLVAVDYVKWGLFALMKSIKDQVNARTIEFKSDKEIIAEAELAKLQSELANERAARVELVLDKFMSHYNQQQTHAGGFFFSPPPLPTTLVLETVSAPIPDPYSDPNGYYKAHLGTTLSSLEL
ncbi:hypothetical protein Tco_0226034 [Tanacetum coccineum]